MEQEVVVVLPAYDALALQRTIHETDDSVADEIVVVAADSSSISFGRGG
jgi:hypothetical protein